jgi:hypothetical protein
MPKILRENVAMNYPLRGDELEPNKLYECDNGTLVIRVNSWKLYDPQTHRTDTIINIANGVGGYSDDMKFRLLRSAIVEIQTAEDGTITQR